MTLRRFVDRAHALGLGVILDVVYNHLGPGRQLPEGVLARVLHRPLRERVGRRHQLRRPRRRAGAGVRRSRTPRTGSASSTSTACGSTRRNAFSMRRTSTSSRRSRRACARRPRAPTSSSSPRTSRSMRGSSVRARPAASASTRSGTTICTTALVVAATGRNEGVLLRPRRARRRSSSRRPSGATCCRASGTAGRSSAAGRRRSTWSRHASSRFSRTTIRSRTRRTGARLHQRTTPGRYRALSALMLLWPGTPMLFQGQEFASSRPFLYFADHEPALAADVAAGRAEFLSQFPSVADPRDDAGARPDPAAAGDVRAVRARFPRARGARRRSSRSIATCCALRRETPAFRAQAHRGVDGAVLGDEAWCFATSTVLRRSARSSRRRAATACCS